MEEKVCPQCLEVGNLATPLLVIVALSAVHDAEASTKCHSDTEC